MLLYMCATRCTPTFPYPRVPAGVIVGYLRSFGMEDFFAPLVARACLQVTPAGASTFNVDSVRVNKIIGGSFGMSALVNGMVVPRDTEGRFREFSR